MNKQYNHITGEDYQGRNQAELMAIKEKRGYKSNAWLTFLQARDKKLKLVNAKGKGVSIFKGYEKFSKITEDKNGDTEVKTESRPLGFATVFNLDHTEKYEA